MGKTADSSRSPADPLRQIELGFMFSHSLMSETSRQLLSTATAAFAVAEMLIERGILDRAAYDARQEAIHATLMEEVTRSGIGVFLHADAPDKYSVPRGQTHLGRLRTDDPQSGMRGCSQ